jgi:RNA polymerase sigma-70 factor (family 1)
MVDYSKFGDHELTVLMKGDDQLAFAELYNRYWKKMLLVAWNNSKDKATSEDIVHEVFISLWDKRGVLELNSVPAFLTTCIKFNFFKNYQKQQNRDKLIAQNYDFSDINLEEEKWDALFLKEYIDGIVERLPEKCRLTFKYSREAGLSNAEIAEKMNISEKGVEANLTRALKIIKGNLNNSGVLMLVSVQVLKNFL